MKFKNKKLWLAGAATALILPTAGAIATSGVAGAVSYTATGTADCYAAQGGLVAAPSLELPEYAPGGYASPGTTKTEVGLDLEGCTSTDPNVTFPGLGGSNIIDGVATGTITSPWDAVEGLIGQHTPFTLSVVWDGARGLAGAALANTTVTVTGDQPYQGLATLPGNLSFFLGTTTKVGNFLGAGPAGFQTLVTTNNSAIPIGGYGYAYGATPGGLATGGPFPVTIPAAPHNTTACTSPGELGTWGYTATAPYTTVVPSGILAATFGNLNQDPSNIGGYVVSNTNTTPAWCAAGDGAITLHTAMTAGPASIDFGLPLTVTDVPGAMGSLSSATPFANCLLNPANIMTYEDNANPLLTDSLCTLKDAGAYTVPGGVGQQAVWFTGATANNIPAASVSATVAFAVNGCTSPLPAAPSLTNTSCNFAKATGSFAQTATSGVVQGNATTTFSSFNAVQGASAGAGLSVIPIGGTDELQL